MSILGVIVIAIFVSRNTFCDTFHHLFLQVTVKLINLPVREVDCVFTSSNMSVMRLSHIINGSVICPIPADAGNLFINRGKILC